MKFMLRIFREDTNKERFKTSCVKNAINFNLLNQCLILEVCNKLRKHVSMQIDDKVS